PTRVIPWDAGEELEGWDEYGADPAVDDGRCGPRRRGTISLGGRVARRPGAALVGAGRPRSTDAPGRRGRLEALSDGRRGGRGRRLAASNARCADRTDIVRR